MKYRNFLISFVCAFALIASGAVITQAQEHPEHPESSASSEEAEHPEHPEESFKVDVEAMAEAITSYIEADSKLKGGYFTIFDKEAKKPLALTLTKVHTERLSKVGANLYFACSDFEEIGGVVYDLDFFMEEVDGALVVTDAMVHKEDGKPRYTWHENDGIWKTRKISE